MHKKQSQSGRSMVEMLGVLAIIGVLSVGGIAGYKTAMERHITNQVLQATDQFYLGYLTESTNDDSPIYDTEKTTPFSAEGKTTLLYNKLFNNAYGLTGYEKEGASVLKANRYGWAVNPIVYHGNLIVEFVLFVPPKTCETVVGYIQSNPDMMRNFRWLFWGKRYGYDSFLSQTPADICNSLSHLSASWGDWAGYSVLPFGFDFPAE